MEKIYKNFVSILASEKFFWGIMIFFIFQAAWIAISANALPFDEQAHFGITQLYAHQWSPFFTHQPEGATLYGPVVRDPSYMYHYLMSFPLRIIAHFTSNVPIQLVGLRLTTVMIFAVGAVIFRRVFLYAKFSRALIHGVFLFLFLIPVVPYSAANVNYDNFLFPLIGLALLLTINISRDIQSKKVKINRWVYLFATCVLASLTKFTFLPILLAIACYLLLCLYRAKISLGSKHIYKKLAKNFMSYSYKSRIFLALLVVLSLGLSFERYGLNMIKYHTPNPQCDVVLSVNACKSYRPWYRNYTLAHSTERTPETAIRDESQGLKLLTYPKYLGSWLNGMLITAFYAVQGDTTALPMPLPWAAGVLGVSAGIILVIYQSRVVLRNNNTLKFLLGVSLLYVSVLFMYNFIDYMHLGESIGVQGRYLIPVLPFLLLLFAESVRSIFKNIRIRTVTGHYIKIIGFFALLLMMLQGGGAATYILKSDSTWYWNKSIIIQANQKAQRTLNAFIIN